MKCSHRVIYKSKEKNAVEKRNFLNEIHSDTSNRISVQMLRVASLSKSL